MRRRIDCANGETRARGSAEGAKAAPADIRDGNHRALSPARKSSVEQALIDMYLGVSVRRVEDITEALRGTRLFDGIARTSPARLRLSGAGAPFSSISKNAA
jgi:hypothetical protein